MITLAKKKKKKNHAMFTVQLAQQMWMHRPTDMYWANRSTLTKGMIANFSQFLICTKLIRMADNHSTIETKIHSYTLGIHSAIHRC